MGPWRRLHIALWGVSLLGVFAVAEGLFAVLRGPTPWGRLFVLAACFALTAPWSLRLPSGAAWRPAMGLLTAGILLLPPAIAPLAAVPGLVLITALGRRAWWDHPLTIGHVAAGLYAGTLVYQRLAPSGAAHLGALLPAGVAGLAAHFLVNRSVSAAIVADRQGRRLRDQLVLTVREIHWGYPGLYLLSLVGAVLYRDEGLVGLLLAAVMMAALHQSLTYYTRMEAWQRAALTDGLTGIGNRSAWEAFARAMRPGRRSGTLAMIDLDGFKAVNDRHGHAVGDAVLRDVAAALQRACGGAYRCFRYGGDEFVLFAPHDPGAEGDLRRQVETCLENLAHQWRRQGHPVRASVGLATSPSDGAELADLLRVADARMYEMKAGGRRAPPARDGAAACAEG